MRAIRFTTAAIVVAVALGCQSKLRFTETTTLDLGETKNFLADGPKYQQAVVVEFTSSDSEISVYVSLGKDRDAVNDALQAHKNPSGILGSVDKSKSGTINVTVPAGEKLCVFLDKATRKTNVTVKLTGQ